MHKTVREEDTARKISLSNKLYECRMMSLRWLKVLRAVHTDILCKLLRQTKTGNTIRTAGGYDRYVADVHIDFSSDDTSIWQDRTTFNTVLDWNSKRNGIDANCQYPSLLPSLGARSYIQPPPPIPRISICLTCLVECHREISIYVWNSICSFSEYGRAFERKTNSNALSVSLLQRI
jgi:hypothetical protein